MAIKSVLACIEGKVQGVWYRRWTFNTAKELGLDGWVMNMADGSVEALFCGEESLVNDMLARCYDGPTFARVQNITTKTAAIPKEAGFNISQ